MYSIDSPVEVFLREFHDQWPGRTSASFSDVEVACEGKKFSSSYDFLVSQISSVAPTSSFLDIGCGDGHLLVKLRKKFGDQHRYAGIDFSSSELKLAAGHLGEGALLCCGNAQTLPFKTGSFDFVLSHMALMLMPNIEAVLKEIARILKPSGKFFSVVSGSGSASKAQEIFTDVLRLYPKEDKYHDVKFSRNRFKDINNIRSMLSGYFIPDSVETLEIELNRSPSCMWEWFGKMYDIKLLGVEEQQSAEALFLRRAGRVVDSEGKLRHDLYLYNFSATAS